MSTSQNQKPASDAELADQIDELLRQEQLAAAWMVAFFGMQTYNDFLLSTLDELGSQQVTWTVHPEMSISGPCEYCMMMNGQVFDINDTPDYPAHISCCCTLDDAGSYEGDLSSGGNSLDYFAYRDSLKMLNGKLLEKYVKCHHTDPQW